MKLQIQANKYEYKIGMNEVVGLREALVDVMAPLVKHLNDIESWSGDEWFKLEDAEYKSRDGFSAYSDNCGGLILGNVIPKCGEYDFGFCDFPEHDWQDDPTKTDEENMDARHADEDNADGYLDSYLRIWFKFEGIDEKTGKMKFYLNASTSDDAPYFRVAGSRTIVESDFEVATLAQLRKEGAKHIRAMIKALK